jgi:signal transduction histidine kinase
MNGQVTGLDRTASTKAAQRWVRSATPPAAGDEAEHGGRRQIQPGGAAMFLAAPGTGRRRFRLPRRTIRVRLTLLYSGLFLASGAGLLALTYLLVARHLDGPPYFARTPNHVFIGNNPQVQAAARQQSGAELHQLLTVSGIALAIMAVAAVGLGWLVAGHVLRPLQGITATTRQISETNLHERLGASGPDDELKDLADTIDGLLARLEAAFDAQRRFVANASHELRTPLAMMRTSLDVATAKPDPVPPQVTTLAGKLREGLDQADRLLESFLTLARAQQGTITGQVTVSLPELLAAAIHNRASAIIGKSIQVRQDNNEAKVAGSETLLARMVDNVIDNAIRHNESGGWIRVETRADGATAHLVVESGGRVLDQDSVTGLAQPFQRLGTDRTGSVNGTGLGLSIVAAIVSAHGGALRLYARPQGGLRVLIELPSAMHASTTGAQA